jgi:alkanesulfonate monooxygenase SsuD/methylene tetrahydromethanopterin reductase-like flavin-dependent oxidoreductase (luciferase family)
VADGLLPMFFAPENVADTRELLEEGAARVEGKKIDDSFDIAPNVNVSIDDDEAAAQDRVRPLIALYVGGMGSREKNFYNQLVQRYGFEDAAREIQDLYLDGKKDEAAAAIPPELIDTVALVGPRDRVRDRLQVYREAGVGTLIAAPVTADPADRRRMVHELAEML